MAVPSVFISSVISGFDEVREKAAEGVERVGMHPVRSERLAAESDSPRRTLLDEVARADIYLLLLGERYGESRPSPTEEEYEEAVRRSKPILVLVREGELEPEQEEFLARVRGSWGEGALSATFSGPEDVTAAVAAALGRHQAGIVNDAPAATARAAELARGQETHGSSSGVAARLSLVPLRETTLLDPEALEEPDLGDALAAALRESGVVSQRTGLDPQISGAGVHLRGIEATAWVTPEAMIDTGGAITVLGPVADEEAPMGFSLVDPDRLEQFVRNAGRFAQLAWDRIDRHGEVTQVAVAAAIPEASYKGFGRARGNSMSMSMSLPAIVIAPDPAEVVPRGQAADERLAKRIVAAIRRVFADAGGIQE